MPMAMTLRAALMRQVPLPIRTLYIDCLANMLSVWGFSEWRQGNLLIIEALSIRLLYTVPTCLLKFSQIDRFSQREY